MPQIIASIAEALRSSGARQVDHRPDALLATIRLANGRNQTIKLTMQSGQDGSYNVVRCQSRACIASGAAMVRKALEMNMTCDHGAYSLDLKVRPHVLDIVYGFVVRPGWEGKLGALLLAIEEVAIFADRVEHSVAKTDCF